jgi:hypothetical protein
MATEVDPADPFAGLEAWQYTARGKLYLRRYTGKHGEVSYEPIQGGQTFHLTPAERHLNSDKVKDPARDPFRNGTCVPVRLTEETPSRDREAIESNPTLLTDDQIIALFSNRKGSAETLVDTLAKIDNPVVLERILNLANDADLPGSRISAIKSRLEDVNPGVAGERTLIAAANEVDSADIYGDTMTGPRTVTAD